jgi:type III secretion protein T
MDGLSLVMPLRELVLLLGLSTTRVAAAFLLVPLFTADLIPATVRNAMFLAIALMSLLMQPAMGPAPGGFALVSLYAKEAFIGGALGLLFAGVMWAFEIAGQLIDTKVGMTGGRPAVGPPDLADRRALRPPGQLGVHGQRRLHGDDGHVV